MNLLTHAIFKKEWIKLRRTGWLLPLFVLYAALDSLLYLHGQDQLRGPLGMWSHLLTREPAFFSSFRLLGLCGVLLGFFQFWPECQGKRMRIFFHMPVSPLRLLSLQLLAGGLVLLAINLLAFGLMFASLRVYHLPLEVVFPVLGAILPWALLSVIFYLVTTAFLASKKLPLRLLVLASGYFAFVLLYDITGYGRFSQAAPRYALFASSFVPLVYFAYLRFLGNATAPPSFPFFRTVALCAVLVGANTVLPDLYWRMAVPERVSKSMLYSPVEGAFVQVVSSTKRKIGKDQRPGSIYLREDGTEIGFREYCRLLPHFYASNLQKWGLFPETIGGKSLTPMQVMRGWTADRFHPAQWNGRAPMLHSLMESEPEGASLKSPEDFFRIRNDGMALEFLRPKDGQVDRKKSDRFTRALASEGFLFPVTALGGNPSTMKSYDVGYFLVDAKQNLFQLQMREGWPHCVNAKQTVPGDILAIVINEKPRREFYGFIVTTDGVFAIHMNDARLKEGLTQMQRLTLAVTNRTDMSLQKLPLEAFDPEDTRIVLYTTIAGNSLQTASVTHPDLPETGLALDGNFGVTGRFEQKWEAEDASAMDLRRKGESFLFPLRFMKSQPHSGWIRFVPVLPESFGFALAGGLLSACLMFAFSRSRKQTPSKTDLLLALAFGPATLLVVALADRDAPVKRLRSA